VFNDVEQFIRDRHLDLRRDEDVRKLQEHFSHDCFEGTSALGSLLQFCHVEPRLPDPEMKDFTDSQAPLGIDIEMTREEIRDRLEAIRGNNNMADLAFHAYRDLSRTAPEPFLLAAVQRNPVTLAATGEMDVAAIADKVRRLPGESIYDEAARLAQPDEVWNYERGDGVEKALLLANVLRSRMPDAGMSLDVSPSEAVLRVDGETHTFPSSKGLEEGEWIIPPSVG